MSHYSTPPHIFWDCLLDGPGFSSPMKTQALIDSRSHIDIIDSTLVDKLALHRCKLPKPLEINLAIGKGGDKLTMVEWVKLAPSLINSSWKLPSTCAIIAHTLTCPIILGHPFLK